MRLLISQLEIRQPPALVVIPSHPASQPQLQIEISIAQQRLWLRDGERTLMDCPISSAANGCGSEEGSHKTPLGKFRIAEKFGGDDVPDTIFKGRVAVGKWDGSRSGDDLILSRILWLDGLEEHNANTKDRYIYIHGTNHEELIGQPASCGCIRMNNADIVELYALTPVDTRVSIC
ncbi:L,D-transpeptidase [Persicirhabdus sediminis]|uniref:L,D-transpeptidase n=1 Tax=Persicirhabdus sediminis TaxID=454144 RepID=A0A8J7ME37_9BACT|nr:L,D-transpeptidase [Persicirhabdus sediminis]MBK1791026.1 L,D-transpeptidase [Persicirhabdus sediminis]